MAVQAISHPSIEERRAAGKQTPEQTREQTARSGDPVAIAGYLGDSDAFDKSITDFSLRYADQNERDYQDFVTAVRSGRLEALEGV